MLDLVVSFEPCYAWLRHLGQERRADTFFGMCILHLFVGGVSLIVTNIF